MALATPAFPVVDHRRTANDLLARLERELDRMLDLAIEDRERALQDLEAIDVTLAAYARWAISVSKSVLDRGAGELARALNDTDTPSSS